MEMGNQELKAGDRLGIAEGGTIFLARALGPTLLKPQDSEE